MRFLLIYLFFGLFYLIRAQLDYGEVVHLQRSVNNDKSEVVIDSKEAVSDLSYFNIDQEELDEDGYPTPRPHSQGLEVLQSRSTRSADYVSRGQPETVYLTRSDDLETPRAGLRPVQTPKIDLRIVEAAKSEVRPSEVPQTLSKTFETPRIFSIDLSSMNAGSYPNVAIRDIPLSVSSETSETSIEEDDTESLSDDETESSEVPKKEAVDDVTSVEMEQFLDEIDAKYGASRQGSKTNVKELIYDPVLGLRKYVVQDKEEKDVKDKVFKREAVRTGQVKPADINESSNTKTAGNGQISDVKVTKFYKYCN